MKSGNVAKSLEIFLSCKIPKSDMVFINKFHLTKFKLVTYFGSIHDPNMCRVSVLGLMFPGGQVRIKGLAQGRGGPHILDDFSPFLAHPKSMGGGAPISAPTPEYATPWGVQWLFGVWYYRTGRGRVNYIILGPW